MNTWHRTAQKLGLVLDKSAPERLARLTGADPDGDIPRVFTALQDTQDHPMFRAGPDGRLWTTVDAVARRTGLTPDAVADAVVALALRGQVSRILDDGRISP